MSVNGLTSKLPDGFLKMSLKDILYLLGIFWTAISLTVGLVRGTVDTTKNAVEYKDLVDKRLDTLTSSVQSLSDMQKANQQRISDMDQKGTLWDQATNRTQDMANAERDRLIHNLETSMSSIGSTVTRTETNVTLLLNYFQEERKTGKR